MAGREAEPRGGGPSRATKRLDQALAGLVSLAMLLLVVEGGLRLLGFGPRPTMNRFDSVLGWSKQPSTSTRRHTAEFDVRLDTNSRGLREAESLGYEKPRGVSRVLLAGDSFTLGYTVDSADTISRLLQDRLRAEGRAVEVINGGTEGYSTDQEVLWLAREGVKYSPDVVVLQMYENDVFWSAQASYLRYPKPRLRHDLRPEEALSSVAGVRDPGLDPWLQRRTALGGLLWGLLAPPVPPMLAGPRPLPAEWEVRLRDDAPGWPEVAVALRIFADVALFSSARPLVLPIPDKAQVDPEARRVAAEAIADPAYDPDRPYRKMIAEATRAGLPVVDPLPALRAASDGGRRALYFGRDWHTNAEGNRVLAAVLDEALAAPGLLGPAPGVASAPPGVAGPAVSGGGVAEAVGWRAPAALLLAWLLLGTAYRRRFPAEGVLRSYGQVGALVVFVAAILVGFDRLLDLLPAWLGRWVSWAAALAILAAILWYLRARLPVMVELFATFVRRGQWYVLPVLVALLSLGGLLVAAASSPWLAPFIYTLF